MKPQFFLLYKSDWPTTHHPERSRVAYLLRAARSRRSNNVHRMGDAYLVNDADFVICPTIRREK